MLACEECAIQAQHNREFIWMRNSPETHPNFATAAIYPHLVEDKCIWIERVLRGLDDEATEAVSKKWMASSVPVIRTDGVFALLGRKDDANTALLKGLLGDEAIGKKRFLLSGPGIFGSSGVQWMDAYVVREAAINVLKDWGESLPFIPVLPATK